MMARFVKASLVLKFLLLCLL